MVVCIQEKFYNVKQEYVKALFVKKDLGELDHPDSSVVNLQNVSHNVKEVIRG